MTHTLSRTGRTALLLACLVSLGACSGLTPKEQRMLTGAAIGTTVGAATVAFTGGCVSCAAAIGGVVGAGSGYAIDYFNSGSDSSSSYGSSSRGW